MKKNILLTIALHLIFLVFVNAQNTFIINNFDVEITLNTDGSFDVTENIKLTFNQEQRGIIRQIPYKFTAGQFTNKKSETQINHLPEYEILVENVEVDNFNFETSFAGNYLEIKIGSADVYLSGEQTYKIKYKVWGALNQFEDSTEFAWNITGNEWNVEIQNATYAINLPKSFNVSLNDISAITGTLNSTELDATKNILGNTISGKTTKTLLSYNGLTVYVNLPSIFENYTVPIEKLVGDEYLKNVDVNIHINTDGSINLIETHKFVISKSYSNFVKSFPVFQTNVANYRDLIIEDYSAEILNNGKIVPCQITYSQDLNYKLLTAVTEIELTDTVSITYKSKIWGAIYFTDSAAILDWDIIEKRISIPIEKTTFKISATGNIEFQPAYVQIFRAGYTTDYVNFDTTKSNEITGYQNYFAADSHYFQCIITMNAENFDTKNIPVEVFAKDYYIENFNTIINVLDDGTMHVKHTFDVHFKGNKTDYYGTFSFATRIQHKYEKSFNPSNGNLEIIYPKWRLFGMYLYPLITDIQSSDPTFHKDSWSRLYTWNMMLEDSSQVVSFDYEYKIFSLLKSDGDDYILNFPVIPTFNEPIKSGTFTLILPDNSTEGFSEFKGYIIDGNKNEREFLMLVKGSSLTGEFSDLMQNNVPIFKIKFSKKYITNNSFGKKIKLLAKNNKPIIFLLLLIGILSVIWVLFGRDTFNEVDEKYFPPAGITSAEAGFIWDNKLHHKDLISLIISWATLGYIEIIEVDKAIDYKFVRRNPFPKEGPTFEKILYNYMFPKDVNERLLSSLKILVYPTVKQTEREFKIYSSTQNFYKPGTIGFSRVLNILSIISASISGFSFLINAFSGDYQTGIIFLLIALILFFYGKIMPKYASFGKEKYAELVGLKKFIDNSSLTKLEELTEKDPDYFSKILPFAIVMGAHQVWAKKFEAISKEAPKWYNYATDENFTPSNFVNSIITCMNRINIVFHIKPVPPKSSSGSFRFSSTSSSYKSSSSKSYSSSSKKSSSSSTRSSGSSRPKSGGGGGKSW